MAAVACNIWCLDTDDVGSRADSMLDLETVPPTEDID